MPRSSTTWQPGQSGNPAGRPKNGTAMSDILREFKERIPPGQEKSAGVLFAESVWLRAINGDPTCVQVIMKWVDGLPAQRIEARFLEDRPDFSRLSNEELKQALALAEKANGDGALPGDD